MSAFDAATLLLSDRSMTETAGSVSIGTTGSCCELDLSWTDVVRDFVTMVTVSDKGVNAVAGSELWVTDTFVTAGNALVYIVVIGEVVIVLESTTATEAREAVEEVEFIAVEGCSAIATEAIEDVAGVEGIVVVSSTAPAMEATETVGGVWSFVVVGSVSVAKTEGVEVGVSVVGELPADGLLSCVSLATLWATPKWIVPLFKSKDWLQ